MRRSQASGPLHYPAEDVMEQAECPTKETVTCSLRACGRRMSAPSQVFD